MLAPTRMFSLEMDAVDAKPVTERSKSLDSEVSVSECRPSPGESSQSTPSPLSIEGEPELPADLKAEGWMVHYSKRLKHYYYHHASTNQSYWQIADVRKHHPFNDPLRIDHEPATSPQNPVTPPVLSPREGNPFNPLKRSHSLDQHPEVPPKKPANNVGLFWNFNIQSGVYMMERKPLHMPRCHPEIEMLRSTLLVKLRQKLQEMCQAREGIDAPSASFLRWLLERRVTDKGIDPVFPSKCAIEVSASLAREIKCDIPIKLVKPKYATDAKKQLIKYAEASRSFIEKRSTTSEDRKKVIFQCENMLRWLRQEHHVSHESCMFRLAFLKRECQGPITQAAHDSVEAICRKLYAYSCDYAAKVYETYVQLAHEQNAEIEDRWEDPGKIRRKCYPIYLSHPILRHPTVDVVKEAEYVTFIYQKDAVFVNRNHVHKLEQLYVLNHPDDPSYRHFPSRTWCMLKRYQTLFGPTVGDGASLQAALPTPVFECLNRVFGVTFECFASPLNCYFKQYCSAFPDTDAYFGSRGNILDFKPVCGSFEANPPWSEELIEATLDHFETLLTDSQEPLSFIVFLPDFHDPPPEFLIKAETHKFNRKAIVLPAYEHEYRDGLQHISNNRNARASHGTSVIFLQNDAGFQKWGPTPESLNELMQASRIKSTY